MQVKLKVLHGSKAGREVKISVPEFIIGRGEGSHLRPRSDLISRHHCAIVVSESSVVVKDLNSRNGVIVNGERIDGEQQVKVGDHLKIGKLEFEIIIDHGLAGTKRPKVKDIKEAAARTAAADRDNEAESITDWLEEADEAERSQRLSDPETRQFKLDETDRVVLENAAEETLESDESENKESEKEKQKKKEYGKLPPRKLVESKDSCEAASEMLKKFFNKR